MKLTVREKLDGRFFIVVILIVIMIMCTFGGLSPAKLSYQGFCKKQMDHLQGTQVYRNTVGVAEEFLQTNCDYIKKKHAEYVESDGDGDAMQLKIIIININIIVLLIVTSLLVFRGDSRPVGEFIEAASKSGDKELALRDISCQESEELEVCSSGEEKSPPPISATTHK